MTDFSGLDEAFGDPPAVKVEESGEFKKGESVEKTSNERVVKLAELRVELTAQEGPSTFLYDTGFSMYSNQDSLFRIDYQTSYTTSPL